MHSIKLAVLILIAAGLTTRAQTPPAAAATLPAGYVGSETCKICHEDIYNQWFSSAHHFSSFNNQWYRKSIE